VAFGQTNDLIDARLLLPNYEMNWIIIIFFVVRKMHLVMHVKHFLRKIIKISTYIISSSLVQMYCTIRNLIIK